MTRGPAADDADRSPEAAAADRSVAFGWHPEPELIGFRDEARSRPALTALGAATWQAALDYVFDEALRRPVGTDTYHAARRRFYRGLSGPGPAPAGPRTSTELLAEFRERLAPYQMNSQHPRQFGYFTPPPLWLSIVGEVLAQVTNQGVDVWHAGPTGTFVEEEVLRWLCDLAGYGAESFGILTSGGVMANVIGMTLARDVGTGRSPGAARPPRGARPRRTPCLRLGPGPLLDRPRPRPARVPHRHAPRPSLGRSVPAPCGHGRRGDRGGSGGRSSAPRHRSRGGVDEHGLGGRAGVARRPRRMPRPVAPCRRRVRWRGPAVDSRSASRHGPRSSRLDHDRSAQVVLPGLRHRGAPRPPTGRPPGDVRPFARVLPERRAE